MHNAQNSACGGCDSHQGRLDLPVRVCVRRVLRERYPNGLRPLDWDARHDGIDEVEVSVLGKGHSTMVIRLASTGQQSPPEVGWTILLFKGDQSSGYSWTLYGIAPARV